MNRITNTHEHYNQVFEQVHLSPGETLTGEFADCKFIKCNFESVVFSNCRFSDCKFQDCNLSLIQIPGSSFPATRFETTKLIGIDWTQGDWSQSEFNPIAGFFDCVLSHSTFIGIDLKGIQMKKCIANEVDFREANLTEVNFRGTDLAKSLFGNTNLTRADLSLARNYQIDPGNNVLKQAKFSLPEAMALLYSMDIDLQEEDDGVW
jgi:uncharacterized protein YjbI with pentapeptide repeats